MDHHCFLDDGTCICLPDCAGKECGPDGCGGICGLCADGTACVDGQCPCEPVCDGFACGDDGCGGSCGQCGGLSEKCLSHICIGNGVCNDSNNIEWDGCGSNGEVNEFQVNSAVEWDQYDAESAVFSHGGYVVVWSSSGGENQGELYGQLVSAEGLPVGNEFQLNATMPGSQTQPAITMLPSDEFVVVWTSYDDDAQGPRIVGQLFAGNGEKIGGEFPVSSATKAFRGEPGIAPLDTGGFVVVWETCPPPDQSAPPQDGDDCGIMMLQFSDQLVPFDNEFQVNLTTAGAQTKPAVTALPGGGFVVVWQSQDQDGDGLGVFGRLFEINGAPGPGEFQVNSTTTGTQERPDVAYVGGADTFVVTWSGKGESDSEGILHRLFTLPGPTGTDEWQGNLEPAETQRHPRVAAHQEDYYVLVWESTGMDGSGLGIYGRAFTTGGASLTDDFKVNKYTTGNQDSPAVATFVLPADHPSSTNATPVPGFIVTWRSQDQDGDANGVFAQRFKKDTTLVYH